jgi:hypothetical protein
MAPPGFWLDHTTEIPLDNRKIILWVERKTSEDSLAKWHLFGITMP